MAVQIYQQRVINEKADLDEKIDSLVRFMESPNANHLPQVEVSLLAIQLHVMYQYSAVLQQRIDRFH